MPVLKTTNESNTILVEKANVLLREVILLTTYTTAIDAVMEPAKAIYG
jgi:hypothetical protein